MIKQKTIYKTACDNCETEITDDKPLMMYGQGDYSSGAEILISKQDNFKIVFDETLHFCSKDCLLNFIDKKIIVRLK